MFEETAAFSLFGLTGYWYGVFVAWGAALFLLFFARYCRMEKCKIGTAALFSALCIPLGLLCSRVLFCLLDFRFHGMFSLRAAAMFWGGGFSMVGALLGAALAAWITARIQKIPALPLLDILMAALPFFICAARMGEGFTELLGRSRPLNTAWLANSFLAQIDGYDAYLRTYLLEALTAGALAIFFAARIQKRKTAQGSLLLGMLLLGTTQALFESLRFDSHMRYSFISMQQILFACMFAAALILYAARCGKKQVIIVIAVCALVAGGAVGLEFMIDRSSVSSLLLYAAYILLLALPAGLGLYYKKRSKTP